MIKAEVISHEGNPGPNWLDHCRSVITPANVTIVALLLIGGALFVGLTRKDEPSTATQLPATSSSQQDTQSSSNSLRVEPLSKMSAQTEDNASSSAPTVQNNATSPSSAPRTPSLNNFQRGSVQPQAPLNKTDLTNTLQSTVQGVQDGVNRTVTGITKGLGL